jgi:NADPH:quinone reductase-like Zn-dependent oxidoreductase
MKAMVIHQYGAPEVLKYEEYPDPVPGPGEVLVRLVATSINPIDIMRRSGRAKEIFPIEFPGVIGVDVAGTVAKLGPGVEGFTLGDKVIAMADKTYAEFCAVKAAVLVKLPPSLDLVDAAALPLVTTTGNQLISDGTGVSAGQAVLVTGAVGNVGRSAVFTAKARGARVIAGVLKRQLGTAESLGADQVIATDDEQAMANLPPLDAVDDTVNGRTATMLLGKVKPGGVFASVLGAPANAKDYPGVRIVPACAKPNIKILLENVRAVKAGKLVIPISRRLPLQDAGAGHAAVEKGGIGKLLLLA